MPKSGALGGARGGADHRSRYHRGEAIEELDEYLDRRGIRLGFAAMKGPVKDRLNRMVTQGRFDEERFHPTVRTAVIAFRHRKDDVDRRDVDAPPRDVVDGTQLRGDPVSDEEG